MSRFKQNWPGYYAVFISKDPVVPQVNYLHRWAWGGGELERCLEFSREGLGYQCFQ